MDEDLLSIQRAYPQVFHACHRRHVRVRSTPHRLSERDASVLAHLDPRFATSPSDLARHLGIGAPTMSATLARLERLGYIVRTPASKDRRTHELRLTSLGVEAMQSSSVLDTERLRNVLLRLTDAERRKAVLGLALLARASRGAAYEENRK